LAEAEQHRIYDRIPPENPYGDIDSLLHAEVGLTKAQAERDVALRAEIAQPQPIQEIGKGTPGPGRGHKTAYNISRLHGDNADYLTARIARDHPDILDRMKAGDYPSVRAAARATLLAARPHTRLEYAPPPWRDAS